MPFLLDGNPTQTEISEAVNYLLSNVLQAASTNVVTGQVIDSSGRVQSYLYKYLSVKYADSFDGTVNFTNSPTNRQYYGLRNNDSSIESNNPADYIWTQVTGGFGTTKLLYYSVTGGRRIDIVVSMSSPSVLYQPDAGTAIDLDVISGSDGASSRICYAKSTSTSLSSLPATYQTTGNATFPPTNTWGGSETWQATPPSLAVNEALFQSDGIYNPMTNLTTWNAPYLSNFKVGQLSAISADLGTVTAGELIITEPANTTPLISGTTMTGAGSHLYSDGKFALGNASGNIVFDGTTVYINGFLQTLQSGTPTSVNTYVNGTNSTYTAYTFSVTKAGVVSLSMFGSFFTVSRTTSAVESVNCEYDFVLKNSSGTTVATARSYLQTRLSMQGIYNQQTTPYATQIVQSLSIDTYTLYVSSSGGAGNGGYLVFYDNTGGTIASPALTSAGIYIKTISYQILV